MNHRTTRNRLLRAGLGAGAALAALGMLLGGMERGGGSAGEGGAPLLLPAARAQGEVPAAKAPKAPSIGKLKTIDGKSVSLEGYKGKVVVMDFWATWCGPCRMTIPSLQSVHGKYAKRGVVVLGVSNEDKGTVAPFAKQMKMTYTLVADEKASTAMQNYGVEGIPTMVVIDKKGRVRKFEVGMNPNLKAEMDRLLPKLLAEKA